MNEIEGFTTRDIDVGTGITIRASVGGSGPPLLLLHGSPEMRLMWQAIAPRLARDYSVVAADLRGYGDSSKPETTPDHAPYAFRAMAADQVKMMESLGHTRFMVAGHDRGARVTHRMALDHPERVLRMCLMDIVPTLYFYENVTQRTASAYFHWFFLIQPYPAPEKMIGADPDLYFLARHGPPAPDWVRAEYRRCWRDPATIHAICEDYRAGATVDLEHDRADRGRKVACPTLVLWGEKGLVGQAYDTLAVWREHCSNVQGRGMPTAHFIPEEAPDLTYEVLRAFLKG
jgi:haloacetate dehalogenase